MNVLQKIRKHGLIGSARKASGRIRRTAEGWYYRWNVRNAKSFADPTPPELGRIEKDLSALGIAVHDFTPRAESLAAFRSAGYFVPESYESADASVWDEKVLEHWIAAERLGLLEYRPADTYVDIAAGNSPWAKILRSRLGISFDAR